MSEGANTDPLWAIRWGKRAIKLALILVLGVIALVGVWFLLPTKSPQAELALNSRVPVFADDQPLGQGEIVLDTDQLFRLGKTVDDHATTEQVAEALFPGMGFQGPFWESAETLWRESEGTQFFLRDGQRPRVFRIWFFRTGEDELLAVPLEFRHETRPLTAVDKSEFSHGWSLKWPLARQYAEVRSASVLPADGKLPGPDEIRIGPLTLPAD